MAINQIPAPSQPPNISLFKVPSQTKLIVQTHKLLKSRQPATMSSEIDREEKWKDLNVTKDELDKIGKALKDEEFRKMFVEYAEEIADPQNRQKYEEEIAMMEAERGMDVQFIHPKPGHVLKGFAKIPEKGRKKAFINICQNEHVEKPSSEKRLKPDGMTGLQWSIPHTFSPAREDTDKKGDKCMVYDVVFNVDTYRMATNPQFRKMLEDTALDGLERQFGIEVDRASITLLKQLKFKGRPEATVLRKKKSNFSPAEAKNTEDPITSSFPYPYTDGVSSQDLAKQKEQEVKEEKRRREREMKLGGRDREIKHTDCGAIIPEHKVTNRYGFEMTDFSQTTSGTQMHSDHIPSAVVVSINLPGLKSASQCTVDVTERQLTLESSSPERYLLQLRLAYPVDDENGSAKFDKTRRMLVVTLPVKRSDVTAKELSALNYSENEQLPTNRHTDEPSTNDPARPMLNGDIQSFPDVKPLIEVLPDITNDQDDAITGQDDEYESPEQSPALTMKTPDHNSLDDKISAGDNILLDDKIAYKSPPFGFEQEEESVSIVINVSHIQSSSFRLVRQRCQVEIQFEVVSPSGFPTHYYSKLTVPEAVGDISRSIGELNTVLTLTKSDRNVWEQLETTSADGLTEVRTFITQKHIEAELQHLDELARAQRECENAPASDEGIVITKKSKTHLTIDIKSGQPSNKPSPKSPKVVHEESVPENVHSILKQRSSSSISESGDDSSMSIDVTDPLSIITSDASMGFEDTVSPRERKKSVSFNEKVEETKFDSSASVYRMHKKLEEQRRKELSKARRRRRNSSGSGSGGSADRHPTARGGRRRRNSSGGSTGSMSDPDSLSPGAFISENHISLDPASTEPEIQEVEECPSSENGLDNTPPNATIEQLNSDDDLEPEEIENNGALSWDNNSNSSFVEKTKCAFDFNNSVIFDLDD